LVDKSLVVHGQGRYVQLETLREYALEQLRASGELDELGRQQAVYLAALGEDGARICDTAAAEAETARVRTRLRTHELDNFRAALAWSLAQGEADLALRLARGLGSLLIDVDVDEGRRWL